VNVIVKDITSDFLAFKMTCKVSVISDITNHLLNAFYTFSSSVHDSHIDSEVRVNALNLAVFKIFINTVSIILCKNNQA